MYDFYFLCLIYIASSVLISVSDSMNLIKNTKTAKSAILLLLVLSVKSAIAPLIFMRNIYKQGS